MNGSFFLLFLNKSHFEIRYDIAEMNLFRSALSACVVNGLTYTKLFLYSNEISPTLSPNVNGQVAATPLTTIRLPPITLTSLNRSLRNFTQTRTQ